MSHSAHDAPSQPDSPVQLAVYDFDGTSITGNSPVMLVRYLLRNRRLRLTAGLRIGLWALRYKLRLPQNESWVRSQVFKAFAGEPKSEVDAYLSHFYDEEVASCFREQAEQSMRAHTQAGRTVVVVSASWEPIVKRAQQNHSFDLQTSTRMHVDAAGRYTRQVEGLPVEGAEKVAALTRLADKTFGPGGWVVTHAYGDHHSDLPLLRMADHPYAVTPDNPLEREAKRQGWPILDWNS